MWEERDSEGEGKVGEEGRVMREKKGEEGEGKRER